MIFQALVPSAEVFAQELDAVTEASVSAACAAGNTAHSLQDAVATALQDADQATSDDAATTPGADAGASEDGNDSTSSDGAQDSATDGTTSGDASTEGDASQGDTTADEGATDEEQADDADADAAAQADVTYEYNTVDQLRAAGVTDITEESGKVTKITFSASADLIKISNTNPTVYQDAAIEISGFTGGSLDVTGKDGKLEFRGFGSSDVPFKGSLNLGTVALAVNRTLFNNIGLSDANKNVAVTWKGTDAQPIVAAKVTGNNCELNANVTVATDSAELKSPLLGEVTGAMSLKATYSVQSGGALKVAIEASSGNVGLLVNTLAESASLTIDELGGTSFAASTIKTTAEGCNAGGLIGECASGSTVVIDQAIGLSSFSVIGKAASGGLIGKATNLALSTTDGVTIKPARNVGDAASACSGGVIGDVSFAQGFTVKPNMFDLGDGVTLGATQRAGALFGMADISAGDIVVQGGMYKSKLASGNGGGSYGGLVGKVLATAKGDGEALRAFVVQKDADKNKCAIEFNLASGLSDAGGVVGYVGDSANPNSQPAAVVLDGVTVTCKGDASARTDAGKLGGAVGVVDTRNVLDVRDFTLASDNPIGKAQSNRAAGIAGSAWNAVIKFSGIADLSDASFAENGTTGQLVYENNNALIFAVGNGSNGNLTDEGATGWTFKRSKTASKTDDIATYGEVIRLGEGLGKSFITLDPNTHVLTLPTPLESANGTYTLTSVEDFAKLAITWQTNGYYSMVTGVSDNNLNGLQSSTITVNGKIELAGTGLTGFTQDRAGDSQVFSGTLNGSGTISLAVGEPYGKRDENKLDESDTSNGNGKIYRHGRLGLFAAVNGATISNVTIAGSMKFDNGSAVDAGSLAGTIDGNLALSGATCETNITCDDTFGNDVNIGGIAGSVTAAATVEFNGSTKAQAIINTGGACYGNTHISGAIGYVGDVAAIITVTALQVGGSIRVDASATAGKAFDEKSSKIVQAGGFIGTIAQGAAKNTTGVNITGLSFNSFNMAVGKSGDRRDGAGGLLGYSWGNAVVTIGDAAVNTSDGTYALNTSNNTTVAADSSSEVGGLVYAASGHWIINNYAINLNGAAFSASAATAFGVLIARASKTENKDAQKYGTEVYTGLYLEDRAYWGEAYRVEGASIGISDNQLKTFDEWIAYGVNPIRKLIDGDWNAVVSLHTETPELDMSGDPNGDNSYRNRTSVGQMQKYASNGSTRYYYNLDRAWTAVKDLSQTKKSDGWMDRPEYLLLWCARLYAPLEVRNYIAPADAVIFDRNNIGSSSGSSIVNIDLAGYSFYPTNISNRDVQIKNAKITLCYSKIKSEQKNNKVNNSATQHENMHCGLIRTIGNKNLTVENVTLSGTVGRAANDKESSTDPESVSGALLLRCAYGASGDKKATIKIETLTLDGLQVDGAEDKQYAPLLINAITRYVNLDVKNVATNNYANALGTNKTAASSLFGRLGYNANYDQVTAKFEQICLPSQIDNSIFTHASLLESFGYASTGTGSADYTFTKADALAGKVTYGSEIDAKDKEYSGKQLWYYDEETYLTESGLVKVGNKTANADTPQFGDYLPYVAKGWVKTPENGVQYHEIRVNQRIPNLMTGCGTYGDPYTVKDATEMNAVANYINNGTALDGWEVTIADKQSELCMRRSDNTKTDNEVVYVYKQSNDSNAKWEKKVDNTTDPAQALADETMRRYVQSAYYSIEPAEGNKITLDAASFGGFGNKANPFRGVIVGDLGSSEPATIEIKNNEGGLRGLVPYSYGSVVRDLNIRYVKAQAIIAYSAKDTDGVPTAFFGGVIGCILGGDNIIDGVVVNGTTADNPTTGFTVAGSSHLVPIGGYVGAIAGGGVIFRNTGDSWRGGTKEKFKPVAEGGGNFQLYDNPYVGRVIDGYAFSEGRAVDNGDANYKINELNTGATRCITTDDIGGRYRDAGNNNAAVTTTVNNAQGLLVLSAIISSGAAGGSANASTSAGTYGTPAGSRAYLGGNMAAGTYQFGNQQYGKVRNASYAYVGAPENAADDFAVAKDDDTKSPGVQSAGNALDYAGDGSDVNSPYLVKKYATWQTGYVCATQVSGMDLQFVNTAEEDVDYDMAPYGSGFTGLSGRYYSNACASNKGADRDRIVPLVACINGNGATIKVKNNTQEYTDDDFCVAGVGGLFNTVTFYSSRYNSESIKANDGANVRNISFKGCDISLSYITTTGTKQSTSGSNGKSGWVGTGCFAGSTANQGGSDGVAYGVFKNVDISDSAVAGGCMAGGLIGSAGLMMRSTDGSNASIVNYGGMSSPVQLYDCSYSRITVSARSNAGGFVGYINSGACGIWVSSDKSVADSSTITIVEKAGELKSPDLNGTAGGIFGLTGGTLSVNTGQGDGASQVATISDVSLIVNHNALGVGGIAGRTVTYQSNINRVKVTSTKKASEETSTYFGSLEAASDTSNAHAVNAGGIIGSTSNSVAINSCTVEKIRMGVTEHAGGLVGATTNGNTLSATNITVDGVQFDGARCGGILGNCQGQGATNVVVANAAVRNCSFGTLNSTWNHGDGSLRNHSGGIVGAASGTIKIANALIRNNDFKQPGGQGFLLGDTAQSASDFKGLYAAGVDIVLKDGSDNSSDPKPIKYFNDSAAADVDAKSYIAFGSYGQEPAAPSDGKTLYGDVAASGNVTAAVAPHVTTSPVSSLSVKTAADETGQTRYLFGDGVNVSGASTIKTDAEDGGGKHYAYTNFDGGNHWSYSPSSAGEFNANNDADATKTDANPDVLVLSGNDSDTVKDYLNIVTNGGYSDALRLNADGSHVSATVDVFQLENGVFVKQSDVTDKALDVKGSGSSLSINANTNWDNGKGRFNLLTVTFTEAGQSYRVMVPIIVKRVLEINFTATYSEGSNFNSDDYSSKYNKHVLISSGETMTGYLTWTYNKAYTQETEYGWDTHLASGGDMRPLNKRIEFAGARGALPAGTQLTFVDTAHNNREYHYTVPGGGSITSVALTDFEDSSRNHYTEQWLSETMGTTATDPKDGSGSWVKLTDEEKRGKTEAELIDIAGAKIGSDYYRVKTDTDTKGPFYNLTVPKKEAKEQPKNESFYLVVRTPQGSANVNGYTGTSVTTTSVNTHLNYTLREDEKKDSQDSHENTASTYSIATNFQHNLVDNMSGTKQMTVSGATYPLDMDVSDTITFGEQEYTSSDELYYQLDSSLVNYEGGNAAGAHGYPTGTQGTYSFYVTVGDNFYAPHASTEGGKTKWTWEKTAAEDPRAVTASWAADGADMKLTLADPVGGAAIDLSGIREIAKKHDSKFTITMKAKLTMTEPACQAGIVASQDGGKDKYTKPNYRAYLSTHADALSTSSNSAYSDGGAAYYRMDVGSSTIALEASKKSQLGINIDDLKSADGEIALVGTYDFSKLNGADAMISSADTVTYTLSLQRRQDGGSYEEVSGIKNYITVLGSDKLGTVSLSADGKSYVFTDAKGTNGFATRDGNSLAFKHAFRVKVNTDVEGKSQQTYANYRLVLTAHMSGGVVNDTPVNANNLDGYSNSDYVTYTLARINTGGIPH